VARLEEKYKKTLPQLVQAQSKHMDPKKHDSFLPGRGPQGLRREILVLWHWAKVVSACMPSVPYAIAAQWLL
jgi:hypothetical protein